jgi:DNA primase
MALIPDDALESIRSRVDIVELVKDYVPQLARAGRSFKARCPFHQERTPSFIVTPERQTFHCFGCGEGGDVFAFLMKMESLSFTEAAEKLADRAGVKIVKSEEALGPAEQERLKIKELLELAVAFYQQTLLKSPAAAAARKYIAERKVSAESIAAFRLGYAPKDGDVAARALRKGFTPELVVKAGLARKAQTRGAASGLGLRDYFFDRILYPIQDAKGAVVGLGARALGEAMPKYLNSPESSVFSKGRVLYGLFLGLPEVRKQRRVVLMEGYMDVMAAHQHGLKTACAPLGTALTLDQVALVKRYASDATVVFDADRPGESAALRSAELLLASGLGVSIATVPQGKDPDEFLHAHGLTAFQKCLDGAVDLAEFQTELALKRRPGNLGPAEKSAVAREVLETISRCPDEVVKGEWRKRLAQRLKIDEESLRLQLAKRDRGGRSSGSASAATPVARPRVDHADRDILLPLLGQPSLASSVSEDDFVSETARHIWKAVASLAETEGAWSARLLDALKGDDRQAASQLLVDDQPCLDPAAELEAILKRRRIERRLREIEPLVHVEPQDKALMAEHCRLMVELKGTKR